MTEASEGYLVEGKFLEVKSNMVAYTFVGSHRVTLKAGEEVVVTSYTPTRINAKRTSFNGERRVLKFERGQLQEQPRRLGDPPADGLDVEDPRIAWIFEDAAKLADRLGLCNDYDRLADQLGLPGRERDFKITFDGAEAGVSLTATIRARSRRQAEARLQSMTKVPIIRSVKALPAYSS
jgi:hypothetical protein